MANEERKEDKLFIKPNHQRKTRNFFVTSSAKLTDNKITKTTISSSHFTEMSKSFYDGEHLLDDGIRQLNGGVIYMLQQMQEDIDDVYNEVSASAFQASFFPFATINSASIGLVSSSLVPDKDGVHHLGSPTKEWQNLHLDGTAYIDSLAMGTTVTSIKDEDNMSSNSATALATQQSIKKYVDDNGGGTVDSSLSNSSTNAVRNSAVHAGLAGKQNTIDASNRLDASLIGANGNVSNTEYGYLASVSSDIQTQLNARLPLTGGTMTGLIRERFLAITSINKFTVDVRTTSILQILIKTGNFTLATATPSFAGQELTIIALTAGVIRHSAKPQAGNFVFANGSHLAVSAGQAYKFVKDVNKIWRQIH